MSSKRDLVANPFAAQLGLSLRRNPSRVATTGKPAAGKRGSTNRQRPQPPAATGKAGNTAVEAPTAPHASEEAVGAETSRQPKYPYFAVDSIHNFVIDLKRLPEPLKLTPAEYAALRAFVISNPGV